jgi:hypothetical protein
MNKLYFQNQVLTPYKKEDLDIANQITVNSEIASTKLIFFRFALWSLIFSIFIIPVSLVTSLLMYRNL